MDLYLMRHGLAEERASRPGLPDAERALTRQGAARVRQVARALGALGVEVQVVLTSSLMRSAQTAEIVAAELGARRRVTAALSPGAAPEALLHEVRKLKVDAALAVGHSPHLELVLARAVAEASSPLCELKKAAVACLDLEEQSGRALLRWLLPPGVIRRLG